MYRTSATVPPPLRHTPVLLEGARFRALEVHARVGRSRFAERHKLPVRNPRPLGTNGYSTSWGTNAHGELSSCPPGRS
ncbi:hypothetical protein KGD83_17240 [Nocardiopsis akebiae]|uniref:Uncharacterized protein n=1 Tax=Nocardiopsis akebiae TaxID=2831968 RepID=A0ABX8CC19_9ACTN|nr:hypothetical protein [Nocardiopsis akebiae]QUX32004.1 hypothetical protein KGD83_17240 [Nocardiopsis akebiae]